MRRLTIVFALLACPHVALADITLTLTQIELHAGSNFTNYPVPIRIDASHPYSAVLTDPSRGSTTRVDATQIDSYRWRVRIQTQGGTDGYGTAMVIFRVASSTPTPVWVAATASAANPSLGVMQVSFAGGGGVFKRCFADAIDGPPLECDGIPEGGSYPPTPWRAPVKTTALSTAVLSLLGGGELAQGVPFDSVIDAEIFAGDTVTFADDPPDDRPLGVWVNAQTDQGQQWQRSTYITEDKVLVLGSNLASSTPPPAGDRIVAFTKEHPLLVLDNVEWTTALENRNALPFDDEIPLELKFWVIDGPPVSQRIEAGLSLAAANRVFVGEGTGLRFKYAGPVEDRIACGKERHLENVRRGPDLLTDMLSLKACGYQENVTNVYLVNSIGYDPGIFGLTPRGLPPLTNNITIIAVNPFASTTAHEIGHLMELVHVCETVGACEGIDFLLNLMLPYTNFDTDDIVKAFGHHVLAEGQIYRALVSPASVVNNTYEARPAPRLQHACTNSQAFGGDLSCPYVLERLFPEEPEGGQP